MLLYFIFFIIILAILVYLNSPYFKGRIGGDGFGSCKKGVRRGVHVIKQCDDRLMASKAQLKLIIF